MATTAGGTGAGVFDNTLMFKSSGNLTATSTVPASGLKIRGTPVTGLAARIMFPTTPGASATVLVAIHESVDDSTYRVAATYPGGALSWASGAQEIMIPFAVHSGFPYVKMVFTLTGGSTACSYGAVQAGIVPRAHGDWRRGVRWD
jgi:hypothetical protein